MRSPAYIEKRATEEVTDLERPTQLSHTHVRHAKKKKKRRRGKSRREMVHSKHQNTVG